MTRGRYRAEIEQNDVAPGSIVRHLEHEEVSRWLADWLQVFGTNRQTRLEVNAKAFLWHLFSSGKYPALNGAQAETEYARHVAPEYIVLRSDEDRNSAYEIDLRPEYLSGRDCMVFPHNLAWTMAFTHEDGWLGPYFAKHENYAVLQSKNVKAVQRRLEKARQTEEAKAKGWA